VSAQPVADQLVPPAVNRLEDGLGHLSLLCVCLCSNNSGNMLTYCSKTLAAHQQPWLNPQLDASFSTLTLERTETIGAEPLVSSKAGSPSHSAVNPSVRVARSFNSEAVLQNVRK
jgi:hypothetical protein